MRNILFDVIYYCVLSFADGKESVYAQIVIKSPKRWKKWISNTFYMNFHLKDE